MLNRQKGGHVGVNEEDCSGVSSASSCSEGESDQKEEETIHVFEPSVEGKLPSSLVAAMRYLLQEPVSCHRSCSLEAAQRFQVQEPSLRVARRKKKRYMYSNRVWKENHRLHWWQRYAIFSKNRYLVAEVSGDLVIPRAGIKLE